MKWPEGPPKQRRRGIEPRLLLCKHALLPVSIPHHPAVVMMLPTVPHPALMFLGWMIPAAWGPGVMVIVVAMISVDPDGSSVRPRTATLVYVMRWPDTNRD